jgi:hypothetical protein
LSQSPLRERTLLGFFAQNGHHAWMPSCCITVEEQASLTFMPSDAAIEPCEATDGLQAVLTVPRADQQEDQPPPASNLHPADV